MQETLQQLSLEISQTQKCTASDFRAKLSVLLESERVSEIQEALSFLRLCGWLVANAFIPNPDGKPQVNHKDGNKHNNSITNLEWVTDSENKRKAVELRTQKEM